jgi:1-aminocyclopropane-1-carboxylate deaminase/D-cysteine desulfhydrase-like pyridoxal-dependent ACC family enzyme
LFEEIDLTKAVLHKIKLPGSVTAPEIFILRLDLIHPLIHGNKFFKMKYNLFEAKKNNYHTLLTFGGAYSNHIHAVSAAGIIFDFKTIGIIRGEEHLPMNPTLSFASSNGMNVHYISRSEYRLKHTQEFQDRLKDRFGNVFIIPEGGTNINALKGCTEIPRLINIDYDYICVACGTAGTFSGVTCELNGERKVLGFAVLKGAGFLIDTAQKLIFDYFGKTLSNWDINLDCHFGGYAKINYRLIDFINEFERLNGIQLDPVYTGKMMLGIYDLAHKGYFCKEKRIIALHTGGIQGREGMERRIKKLQPGTNLER